MEHDLARLRALFDEVMQAPAESRAALLTARCGADAALRRRVEAASAGGEALGEQRLHDALLDRDAFSDAAGIVTRIGNAWTSHLASAQADDDALVVVLARG